MIKSLEIHGFKSFDSRISIPLSKGFTAIVGPNGSGKSNVVDAVCFVLGMTSARSMRAERLTHLIYNGGKNKTPANFLEVSIVFDNSKKDFPFDEDVVTVSRRLTRKGTMSYKLNGKTCTRTQLIDMLSTNMFNPEGHNIVQQGDITNFIEMDPIGRRQIIDEICGISEYDEKKEKAKRDLDEVEVRVKELVIVMSERKKHLNSLKKEKDDAEKYESMQNEAKEIEANLAFTKLKEIEEEEAEISGRFETEESNEKELTNELNKIEDSLTLAEEDLQKLDKKLIKEGGEEQISIKNEIERINSRISINDSKVESKRAEIARIDSMVAKLQFLTGEKGIKLSSSLKEKFPGVHGTIGELMQVDAKYTTAIESSLGARINFLVVDNEDVAIQCIEYLKENKRGRATFLPLTKIRGPQPETRSGRGIIGAARHLIEFKEEYKNIFSYVLGNTYVVTDLKTVKGFIGKVRMVSLDGDIAERSGALTGGFRKKAKGVSGEVEEYVKSRDNLIDEIEELQLENESLKKSLEESNTKAQKLGIDFEKSQRDRDSLIEEVEKLRAKRETIILERDSATRNVSDIRVEKARVDAKLTDIKINMKKFKNAGLKKIDIKSMEERLEKVIIQTAKLEPVNMKAIEEYESAEKEYNVFDEKFSKLQEERKSVLDFIDKIEEKKKEVFYSVFDKVSEEFQKIFPKLSPQGEVKLFLENKEAPLSGGMFIEAKPAGKKLLSIESMSGGEKVLTALAFLFSLQRYKPAPFYVLDEVDAALDQQNSMRFVDMLNETIKDAQLLVISHNNAVVKKAERIFGVSMTDNGVSKVVGMDLGNFETKAKTLKGA